MPYGSLLPKTTSKVTAKKIDQVTDENKTQTTRDDQKFDRSPLSTSLKMKIKIKKQSKSSNPEISYQIVDNSPISSHMLIKILQKTNQDNMKHPKNHRTAQKLVLLWLLTVLFP